MSAKGLFTIRSTLLLAAGMAGALAFAPVAEARVRSGTLTCHVAGGIGLILGSRRSLTCEFHSGRAVEFYTGRIDRIGLDIGITQQSEILWGVFERTRQHSDLSGRYTGATAQATIGVGLGANVLVGGGQNSIALQPLSISGQTGLNVAAGISSLHLERRR